MIQIAKESDMDGIMEIIQAAKEEMHSYGNYQWDEGYPKPEHFTKDIEEGSLYVYELEGSVLGFICVNKEEPEEYSQMGWSSKEEALTIHRLAVNKNINIRGVAQELMEYAEVVCKNKGVHFIKTDTNKLNVKAQGLLKKCGYTFLGETSLYDHEGTFYCYEKSLAM